MPTRGLWMFVAFLFYCGLAAAAPGAGTVVLLEKPTHRRGPAGAREWDEFPESSAGESLELRFDAPVHAGEATLFLRQRDVRQRWAVSVNGQRLGLLREDENALEIALAVPAGLLRAQGNALRVAAVDGKQTPDDVELGPARLTLAPRGEALSAAKVRLHVYDPADTSAAGRDSHMPCRFTIADASGALAPLGNVSSDRLAVREGVVYSLDGEVTLSLPAGNYTAFAGRGLEYSAASAAIQVQAGEAALDVRLPLTRQVPTPGLVAMDTHVHTLTHSKHGDASAVERLITLAGEGVELAVITEHNLVVDLRPELARLGADKWVTLIAGNEYTTRAGHYNIFPASAGQAVPNPMLLATAAMDQAIADSGAQVVILNHGRDVHGGFTPLSPSAFLGPAGRRVWGGAMAINAMEVANSGATRTDALELARDWLAILNTGARVAAVGSSDSHDVSRYIVGQGRTYVAMDDADAGRLDPGQAIRVLREGNTRVSLGLIVNLRTSVLPALAEAAGKPGQARRVVAQVEVLGPDWTRAERVTLYANAGIVGRFDIPADRGAAAGVKAAHAFELPAGQQDMILVAIAEGPGVVAPYWPIAKPYQRQGPRYRPRVLGVSPAARVDADGDGVFKDPRTLAGELVAQFAGDFQGLLRALERYDAAAATQAADLWALAGRSATDEAARAALAKANAATRAAFASYELAAKAIRRPE